MYKSVLLAVCVGDVVPVPFHVIPVAGIVGLSVVSRLDLLFQDIGSGGIVTLEQIKTYAKDNPKTYTETIQSWFDECEDLVVARPRRDEVRVRAQKAGEKLCKCAQSKEPVRLRHALDLFVESSRGARHRLVERHVDREDERVAEVDVEVGPAGSA